MENPFRPSAGATPPEILGRAGLLDEFDYGLRLGSGAPGLLTIFTGARGIGKTVMLGAAHDTSPKDMEFLHAMAKDDKPSVAGDIGRRLGAKTNLVANYRTRLLAAGLIESVGHGKIDFAIPGLRRYLSSKPAG
ncbi:hypothetical protein [Cryobacterium sp. Y29]|uniref:hypothetical protein n=1 Tax=Cryobacterium sp. Y29 TaxID=2048285 RepID=UPI000CE454A3|nr:hypothetical protein [Cryobacterium sp. Y29]